MTPGKPFDCPEDLAGHCRLVLSGEYDVPTPVAPATVLDIGASVGPFTRWALAQWPNAEIHAFDPLPEHADLFKINNPVNFGQVHFSQVAVRASTQAAPLRRGMHNSGEASFHDLGEQTADTTLVPCVDAARLPRCDFVKLDTEGCELEILEHLDLSQTKTVVLEYHSEADAGAIRKLLLSRGFKLHSHTVYRANRGLLKFVSEPLVGHTFIALPIHRSMDGLAVQSLLQLVASRVGHIHIHHALGDSLISRARNILTAEFVDSACDSILWIDSDILYTPDQVSRILSHPEEIVGGLYPKKKSGPPEWVVNTTNPPSLPRADGLQEVRYVGTGFMRVRRSVFDAMLLRYGPQMAYQVDGASDTIQHDFWPVGPYQYKDGFVRYLSEDWYFCQRWIDLGGHVWADIRIQLPHVGTCIYPQILTGQSATAPENPGSGAAGTSDTPPTTH